MNLGMSLTIHCEDSVVLEKATKIVEETLIKENYEKHCNDMGDSVSYKAEDFSFDEEKLLYRLLEEFPTLDICCPLATTSHI